MNSQKSKNKFLLIDDLFTAEKTGFKTTINQAQQIESPLLVADQPWEREGIDYTRNDDVFLGLGKFGDMNVKQIYMATGMVKEDKSIYMYYLAYNAGHDGTRHQNRKGAIGRISIRKDGFISQDTSEEGTYTTVPVSIQDDCTCIKVNLETNSGGFMKYELLSPSGDIITGKNADNSDMITGDHTDIKMSWNGSESINTLRGQNVKIRFIGKSVKLYSFQLC